MINRNIIEQQLVYRNDGSKQSVMVRELHKKNT
jgi:hypothetical protein